MDSLREPLVDVRGTAAFCASSLDSIIVKTVSCVASHVFEFRNFGASLIIIFLSADCAESSEHEQKSCCNKTSD